MFLLSRRGGPLARGAMFLLSRGGGGGHWYGGSIGMWGEGVGLGWVGLGRGLAWSPTHGPRRLPSGTRLCGRTKGYLKMGLENSDV